MIQIKLDVFLDTTAGRCIEKHFVGHNVSTAIREKDSWAGGRGQGDHAGSGRSEEDEE